MSNVIDKKAFWSDLLDDLYGVMDTGFYFMLKNEAYIDRIEDNVESYRAVIACKSETLKTKFEQKYMPTITKAFVGALGRKVTITLVHGPARIFHKIPNADESPDYRREELFRKHHHIMGIVMNDAIFRQASLPVEEGGWGIFPEKLTNHCVDYGVIKIQDAIAKVARMPKVDNARGFFDFCLERGDFGPKLKRGADILGLRA
jgi:hypothetical protein